MCSKEDILAFSMTCHVSWWVEGNFDFMLGKCKMDTAAKKAHDRKRGNCVQQFHKIYRPNVHLRKFFLLSTVDMLLNLKQKYKKEFKF